MTTISQNGLDQRSFAERIAEGLRSAGLPGDCDRVAWSFVALNPVTLVVEVLEAEPVRVRVTASAVFEGSFVGVGRTAEELWIDVSGKVTK